MAATDLLTIDEARAAINITTDAHDAELALMVSAVSEAIVDLVGPVVSVTVTDEVDGNRWCVSPSKTPVLSVTSVTEASGTSTTVLTASSFGDPQDYLLDGTGHAVRFVRESGNFADRVQLVYTAGRCADTASVPPRYKLAASVALRGVWKRESPSWAQSSDFFEGVDAAPAAFRAIDSAKVRELLRDQLLPPGVA